MGRQEKEAMERLKRSGLKLTRQRETICEVFFAQKGHCRAEEILNQARLMDANVSLATVYRTLKILQENDFAIAHNFKEGQALFEPNFEAHHDHLICTKCGRIDEFVNDEIERLQKAVAKAHGFTLTHHKMEIYGLCTDCQ